VNYVTLLPGYLILGRTAKHAEPFVVPYCLGDGVSAGRVCRGVESVHCLRTEATTLPDAHVN